MKISEAISQAQELTGQVVSTARLVGWLSELDGKIALTFFREDEWTPYDPTDLTTDLLIPQPWDGLYRHWLAAMTYFSNGEYDRYENERAMFEVALKEYYGYMRRSGRPPCDKDIFCGQWLTM